MDNRRFSELVSETITSADEVASLAKDSEIEAETLVEFSAFIEKLSPLLSEFKENNLMDTSPIRKAVQSLKADLRRSKGLMRSADRKQPPLKKQIEEVTHDLGRSLGLVLFALHDVPMGSKEKIESLRREMMNARFNSGSESEFVNDFGTEETGETGETGETECEIQEEASIDRITMNIDDVVLQLKYGKDDEFQSALLVLNNSIGDNSITSEWITEEGVIPILFNRLSSSKPNNRLTIIQTLRSLASQSAENKVYLIQLQ